MDKVFGKKVQEIAINIKENILMTKKMDMEYLHGQQETYIKAIMKQISETVMERCIGMMAAFSKDSGRMEFSTDMVIMA